jgi:uncharacterized membrane protein
MNHYSQRRHKAKKLLDQILISIVALLILVAVYTLTVVSLFNGGYHGG